MNYIVLDLEWNQSNTTEKESTSGLSFEIIEIGAIKCNQNKVMIDEFHELIKPQVYHEMHRITSKIIRMQMKELERGDPFPQVMQRFLDWCGGRWSGGASPEYLFCTWGPLDLGELQKNMEFYGLAPLSDGPIPFLDIQKLFSIAYEDGKLRRGLEYVVDYLQIEKDIPFHRAFSDAYYTAKVLSYIHDEKVFRNVSYDVYHLPKDRKGEIKAQFDTYMKYISRQFHDKEEAFTDREVVSTKCYLCHRNLRKRIRWFTANGRHYYALAYCDKHGYLKGKIRVRKNDKGYIYIVKTTKLISAEEVELLVERQRHAKEMKKRKKS